MIRSIRHLPSTGLHPVNVLELVTEQLDRGTRNVPVLAVLGTKPGRDSLLPLEARDVVSYVEGPGALDDLP